MSYIIQRLIKSKSREGKEELFIHLAINDELGLYEYGEWLKDEDICLIKKSFEKKVYNRILDSINFSSLKNKKYIEEVAKSCLLKARAQRILSLKRL